jgi:hypothetical protein
MFNTTSSLFLSHFFRNEETSREIATLVGRGQRTEVDVALETMAGRGQGRPVSRTGRKKKISERRTEPTQQRD